MRQDLVDHKRILNTGNDLHWTTTNTADQAPSGTYSHQYQYLNGPFENPLQPLRFYVLQRANHSLVLARRLIRAASVATMLREFYGMATSEQDVLARLTSDGRHSFSDLEAVVEHWDLKGTGIALGYANLTELKAPAVAYFLYQGHHRSPRR